MREKSARESSGEIKRARLLYLSERKLKNQARIGPVEGKRSWGGDVVSMDGKKIKAGFIRKKLLCEFSRGKRKSE